MTLLTGGLACFLIPLRGLRSLAGITLVLDTGVLRIFLIQ